MHNFDEEMDGLPGHFPYCQIMPFRLIPFRFCPHCPKELNRGDTQNDLDNVIPI